MVHPDENNEYAQIAWLASSAAEEYLQFAAAAVEAGDEPLQIQTRLRRSLPVDKAAAVVQQIALRRKAKSKFACAAEMLFTATGLQQATGEAIAQYKSARLHGESVVDLCCGIGGDLIAFCDRGPGCVGVDLNPAAIECARFNLRAHNQSADLRVAGAESKSIDKSQIVHIDPDRRQHERKTVDLNFYSPDESVLSALTARAQAAGIKLAPATAIPESWRNTAERQWIGYAGECKQQMVWFGDAVRYPSCAVATVIDNVGEVHECWLRADEAAPEPSVATHFGDYLLEPHPAVCAAGLQVALARQINAPVIGRHRQYLVSSHPIDSRLVRSFQVLHVCSTNRDELRRALQRLEIGSVDVKSRGVPVKKLPQIPRQSSSATVGTLFVVELDGRIRCAICR